MSGHTKSRVKFVAAINQRALPETTDPDREIRYVDISAVGRGVAVAEPEQMTFAAAPSRARRLVQHGDTIVSTVRTYLRAVLPIRHPDPTLVVSTGFAVLTPGSNVDPGYFAWVMQSDPFVEEIVARSGGVSYPAINASEIGDIQIPVMGLSGQRAIADYLDTETARIDALIAKKQRMVELLEEARLARLRNAVAVASPKTVRLRYISRIKRGQSPRPIDDPAYFDVNGSHGWVRIEDATRQGMYLRETRERLSENGKAKSVAVGPGTVLVSIAASVGRAVITDMDCCYHDGWVGLLDLTAIPEFVYYCLSLPETFGGLGQVGTQTNINSDIVGRVEVPLLGEAAQRAFVQKMEGDHRRVERSCNAFERQIELLRERRQALITAAVTGEIEVPGAAA